MKTNFEVLYRRIGLLFYAAAQEQKRLTIDDYDRLKAIIRNNFADDDGAPQQLPGDLYKEVFRSVRDAFGDSMSAKEAMQLFSIFYNMHHMAFDSKLKFKILSTYHDVVEEFSDHNGAAPGKDRQLTELLLGNAATMPTEHHA